jgi:choline dehydrogenase-like flavoprotein
VSVRPTGGAAYADYAGGYRPREERVEHGARLSGRVRVRADVCVVGTGAGGAVVAKELAEGGLSVVMLEEGEVVRPEQLTARPREESPRRYRDGGQVTTLGNVPIVLPLGRAVGGTTVLNSATCYRPPPAVLAGWAERDGLDAWCRDALEPFLRRAERILNVCRVPRDVAGRNAHLMELGAQRLGWSGEYLHRAARGCEGAGVCAFGCPSGAKQHTGNTYVPRAWDAGAVTFAGCRATKIVTEGDRATGVEARTTGGARLRVEAPVVVVACGTIQTPVLLHRSGVRHRVLGRNLSLHPASGVWAEHPDVVDMAHGVPQAYAVDEFAAEGLMLEGWTGPPDMLALSLPATGAEHRRVMLAYRHVAQAGLMIRDRSRGRVHTASGRPVVRYDLSRPDTALLVSGIARAAELELAAGAHTVHVPVRGRGPLRTADQARALAGAHVRPRDLSLTAFHPLGTARASQDPGRGLVDADLRKHGTRGLLIADGSVVPSALGVNPQLTIMALATRAAFALLGRTPPDDEPRSATTGRAPAAIAA